MNGGYSMIDCTGLDLGNLGTVTGLYEKAKAAINTGKPLVLKGVKNNTQEYSNIPAYGGIQSSTAVLLTFYPVKLRVSNEDVVTSLD